jgi:hypothetical protein
MGALMPNHDTIHSGREYYGESSLGSLVREFIPPPAKRLRLNTNWNAASQSPRRPLLSDRSTLNSQEYTMLSSQFALPPREIPDKLLNLYFSNVHIFYPYTHSITFRKAYNRLSAREHPPDVAVDDLPDVGLGGPTCSRQVFFSTLNAMFALACEFSGMLPEEEKPACATFFYQIRSLLRFDVFENGSLAQVQALLLVGHYLSCTHYPAQC